MRLGASAGTLAFASVDTKGHIVSLGIQVSGTHYKAVQEAAAMLPACMRFICARCNLEIELEGADLAECQTSVCIDECLFESALGMFSPDVFQLLRQQWHRAILQSDKP